LFKPIFSFQFCGNKTSNRNQSKAANKENLCSKGKSSNNAMTAVTIACASAIGNKHCLSAFRDAVD